MNWRSGLQIDWSLFEDAGKAWSSHDAQRLGAALSYYTILSLAPLLVIFASIASLVFGDTAVRGDLYGQIRAFAGDQGAAFIQNLLKGAKMHSTSGIFTSVVASVLLLFGASGVFLELRDDLNYIWDVPLRQESMVMGMLRYRLFSFGLVLGSGMLITLSMTANVAIHVVEKYALGYFRLPGLLIEAANFSLTFFVSTFLFGAIYVVLPDRRVPWMDVAVGSIVTAGLFTAGKSIVAFYLGRAGVGSLYGAAGSLVVLLVWVYYSSQIFLFGAEFTHVYSQRHGLLRTEVEAGSPRKGRMPGS